MRTVIQSRDQMGQAEWLWSRVASALVLVRVRVLGEGSELAMVQERPAQLLAGR